MQSLCVIFVALLSITACGSGETAVPAIKKADLAQSEAQTAPEITPDLPPDWASIYQSDVVEELAPPEIGVLEERFAKDRERLSEILATDLRAQRSAVRNMQARLGMRPTDTALRFKLGEFYYLNELPHLAEIEFLTLLAQEPEQTVAGTSHKYLTDIYLQSGAQGRACYHARRAHRDLPQDGSLMFIWAWTLRDGGDLETAAAVAEAGVALEPKNPSVLVMLARLRSDEERFEEAIALARRAVKANPDHLRAHMVLGQALSVSGHEEEAHEEMEIHRRLLLLNTAKLLGRKPRLKEYERAAALVSFHLHVGHMSQAREELARSLALKPGNSHARVMEARILIAEDKESDAFLLLDALFEEHPDDPMVRRALAALLVTAKEPERRNPQRAYELASGLLRDGGARDVSVLYSLGLAEVALGFDAAARNHFQSALAIEPASKAVLVELAKLDAKL